MALLAPYRIPGFDWLVLKLLVIIVAVLITAFVIAVSSIVGLIRAVRRRRRGEHSIAAVVLSSIALAIASSWLLYWAGDAVAQHENPLNSLLAINFAVCLLPFAWLVAAIFANRGRHREADYKHQRVNGQVSHEL